MKGSSVIFRIKGTTINFKCLLSGKTLLYDSGEFKAEIGSLDIEKWQCFALSHNERVKDNNSESIDTSYSSNFYVRYMFFFPAPSLSFNNRLAPSQTNGPMNGRFLLLQLKSS